MEEDTPQQLQAPQWLLDLLGQQTKQIAALADKLDSLTPQQYSPGLLTPNTLSGNTSPQLPADPTMLVRRPKAVLPDVTKYDGLDKALYPQFAGSLRAKLEIDGEAIGGERERVWYGFGRLKGEGASRVFPWIEHAQRTNNLTVTALFQQMDTAFRDPRTQEKALAKINKTKQGATSYGEFLTEFDRLLLEADGWGWPDNVKKGYLKAAISTTLLTAMVGTREAVTYDEYCSQLRMTSDQLDEVKEKKNGFGRKWNSRTDVPTRTKSPARDTMDWEPTTSASAAHTGPREPRWASDEEIERRRQEGLCLRCGDASHMVRGCKAKLTIKAKPRTKPIRAAPVEKKMKKGKPRLEKKKRTEDEGSDDEDTTSSDESSGKE
jgi:hypothetical protein